LDTQIAELTELRGWLRATVTDWNQRLKTTGPGKRVELLESLVHRDRPIIQGQRKPR
jgi:hypothetical protein